MGWSRRVRGPWLERQVRLGLIGLFAAGGLVSPGFGQAGPIELSVTEGAAFDRFGSAVALEGDRLLVSATDAEYLPFFQDVGAVYVFERQGGAWTRTADLRPSDPVHEAQFGRCLLLGGATAFVGAPLAATSGVVTGAVYVFENAAGVWTQTHKLVGTNCGDDARFGVNMDLSDDRLLVGAPGFGGTTFEGGAAFLFERGPQGWIESARLEHPTPNASDRFGFDVAIDGTTLVVSAPWRANSYPGSGAVYVFAEDPGQWGTPIELVSGTPAPHQQFGRCVELDGSTLVASTPSASLSEPFSGGAWIFEREGSPTNASSTWREVRELLPTESAAYDRFGDSMSLHGDRLVIGAPWSDASHVDSGRLWLLGRAGYDWIELGSLAPPTGSTHSGLARATALTDFEILAGAPYTSTSIDGVGSALIWRLGDQPGVEAYCFGVGCPCGNETTAGGCENSTGVGARLSMSGSNSMSQTELNVHGSSMPPNRVALLLQGGAPSSLVFGDGLLCVNASATQSSLPILGGFRRTDPFGEVALELDLRRDLPDLLAGSIGYFQLLHRDGVGPCNGFFNLSNAIQLEIGP